LCRLRLVASQVSSQCLEYLELVGAKHLRYVAVIVCGKLSETQQCFIFNQFRISCFVVFESSQHEHCKSHELGFCNKVANLSKIVCNSSNLCEKVAEKVHAVNKYTVGVVCGC
jgi:hypothetical protein